MADDRRFELEDILVRPGCYLNPQTEILVIVDDSPSIDGEIFNLEEFEGADWVLIADDVPVDESRRDEMLETFQATYHGGDGRSRAAASCASIPAISAWLAPTFSVSFGEVI